MDVMLLPAVRKASGLGVKVVLDLVGAQLIMKNVAPFSAGASSSVEMHDLLTASETGDVEKVRLLLDRGADVDPHSMGASFAKQLLDHGAQVNMQDSEGRSPLMVASYNGHQQTVEYLLGHGAEVNMDVSVGLTPIVISPLALASGEGHTEIVRLLVDNEAQVNVASMNSISPLAAASAGGHAETVSLLIEQGADVNSMQLDLSPLMVASCSGHHEVVKILLDNDADVNLQNSIGLTSLALTSSTESAKVLEHEYLEFYRGANIQKQLQVIKTSIAGHSQVLQLLLDRGAEVDGPSGKIALGMACFHGHDKTVRQLLAHGAQVNLQLNDHETSTVDSSKPATGVAAAINYFVQSLRENPALAVASTMGHTETVEILLNHGAEVNMQDKEGSTALMAANINGHLEIVQLLVHNGAKINTTDEKNNSALILACHQNFGGHLEIVEFLLDNGAQVNMQNETGDTALTGASSGGHQKIVKVLLDHGAQVNVQNREGVTALMLASFAGHHNFGDDPLQYPTSIDITKSLGRAVSSLYQDMHEGMALSHQLQFDSPQKKPTSFRRCSSVSSLASLGLRHGNPPQNAAELTAAQQRELINQVIMASRGPNTERDERLNSLQNAAELTAAQQRELISHVIMVSRGATTERDDTQKGLLIPSGSSIPEESMTPGLQSPKTWLEKHGSEHKLERMQNVSSMDLNSPPTSPTHYPVQRQDTDVDRKVPSGSHSFIAGHLSDAFEYPTQRTGSIPRAAQYTERLLARCCTLDWRQMEQIRRVQEMIAKQSTSLLQDYDVSEGEGKWREGGRDTQENIQGQSGESAVTLASKRLSPELPDGGHLEVVKCLLNHGAQVNIRDKKGHTALMAASSTGHLDIVKLLVHNGIDEEGIRALILAGHLEIVKFLLDNGAQVNTLSETGDTALTLASYRGHLEIVKFLLDNCAQIDMQNETGDTALTLASSEGHLEIVKLLLDNGALVNVQTHNGATALMSASYRGHLEIVKYLLCHGAQVYMQTLHGDTALTLARYKGHLEIVHYLVEWTTSMNHIFTVDSAAVNQTYSWPSAGLSLHLPTGPLSEELNGKLITLNASMKGSYVFPPNSKLVSAIYNITSDVSLETVIELEHCHRGDLQALTFVYSDSSRPPFIFRKSDLEQSFTLTHGTVGTTHFSYWTIIAQLLGLEAVKPTGHTNVKIIVFCHKRQSHVEVDLVLLKGLSAHSEVNSESIVDPP